MMTMMKNGKNLEHQSIYEQQRRGVEPRPGKELDDPIPH